MALAFQVKGFGSWIYDNPNKSRRKGVYLLAYNSLVMGKLQNFLSGARILEEVESPINGRLTVIRDLAWGVHIKAGGLTQSGGIAKKVWDPSLRRIKKSEINKCLILGLGGGGMVEIINKYWPQTKMTGVEIDPIMVDLGKKHLGLKETGVKIVIEDAHRFIEKEKEKYDLILVDIYIGDKIPRKFETEKFIKIINKLLRKNGIVIFNRLYYDEKRKETLIFGEKLEKEFSKAILVYPEANIMFVCTK